MTQPETRGGEKEAPIVYIVDDDWRVREALEGLLAANDLTSISFQSISAYLSHSRADRPACLILDIELPDVSGLEFQKQNHELHPPIVFITGHGDIPSSVSAIKHGAVDFLTKPFDETVLLAAVDTAIELDRTTREERTKLEVLRNRHRLLTSRESEVLPLVVSGLLNKQAAAQLGISEVTMQIHRGKIMQKMEADSLADLVRMAETLGIPARHTRRRGFGSK
jgi:FixJ family two-component response regulator